MLISPYSIFSHFPFNGKQLVKAKYQIYERPKYHRYLAQSIDFRLKLLLLLMCVKSLCMY